LPEIRRCLDGMSGKKEMTGLILLFSAETFGITYSDFNPVPISCPCQMANGLDFGKFNLCK
jgi:hypothetical protein